MYYKSKNIFFNICNFYVNINFYTYKRIYLRLKNVFISSMNLRIIFLFFFSAFSLKLTELKIEEHTLVGNSTRLECKYDLQGEKLYTVKWYKDGNEFYRYIPGESPEVQTFNVTGVHVDVSYLI